MCDVCVANAVNNGTCQCVDNAIYVESKGDCECEIDYELVEGSCRICNRWIQAADITAEWAKNYIQIYFYFAIPVDGKGLSCDSIFYSVFTELLGAGYFCSFNTEGTVLILTLGLGSEFIQETIGIKAGVLRRVSPECGYQASDIYVNIQ